MDVLVQLCSDNRPQKMLASIFVKGDPVFGFIVSQRRRSIHGKKGKRFLFDHNGIDQ